MSEFLGIVSPVVAVCSALLALVAQRRRWAAKHAVLQEAHECLEQGCRAMSHELDDARRSLARMTLVVDRGRESRRHLEVVLDAQRKKCDAHEKVVENLREQLTNAEQQAQCRVADDAITQRRFREALDAVAKAVKPVLYELGLAMTDDRTMLSADVWNKRAKEFSNGRILSTGPEVGRGAGQVPAEVCRQ